MLRVVFGKDVNRTRSATSIETQRNETTAILPAMLVFGYAGVFLFSDMEACFLAPNLMGHAHRPDGKPSTNTGEVCFFTETHASTRGHNVECKGNWSLFSVHWF